MIEKATVADLRLLIPLFNEFHAASKLLSGVPQAFLDSWAQIICMGLGVVFLQRNGGEIVGTIGGIATRDVNSGQLVASEGFWFVKESNRGAGFRLYREFEKWAKERRCTQIQMVHLLDVQPEKMARVYQHMGYTPVETRYVKALQ